MNTAGHYGLHWKLVHLLRRPVLWIGLTAFLILGVWTSRHILFVYVDGNVQLSDKQIIATAQQCGIGFGAVRREVRSEKMKNALLEAMPQLQWAGINTKGCVAMISVKERPKAETEVPASGVSSIIASRDGVITELTVTRGSPSCKVGQAVKAGQILISGYTDLGLVIRGEQAQGEVFAATQRKIEAIVPSSWQIRRTSTATHKKYSLIIGKKRINFYKDSGISPSSCVKMYDEVYATLPGGFVLPICLVVETWTEWNTVSEESNSDEDHQLLREFANSYLQQQMICGTVCRSWEEDTEADGVRILAGHYDCLEMIGQSRNEEIIGTDG